MTKQTCYNQYVDFTEWINQKFLEWRGSSRKGVSDFARFVGVSQQSMSSWMNGTRKDRLTPQSISKLAEKFPDVYDVVGISSPWRNVPPDLRRQIEAAQAEVDRILAERGITGDMPEAEQIAIKVFTDFGFKFIKKQVEPD